MNIVVGFLIEMYPGSSFLRYSVAHYLIVQIAFRTSQRKVINLHEQFALLSVMGYGMSWMWYMMSLGVSLRLTFQLDDIGERLRSTDMHCPVTRVHSKELQVFLPIPDHPATVTPSLSPQYTASQKYAHIF